MSLPRRKERESHPGALSLEQLVADTEYAGFNVVSTRVADGSQVYDVRNLVILSRFPIAISPPTF